VELRSADIRDRSDLAYDLEEKLPLSLEDFVADFTIVGRHSKSTLGVAVAIDDLTSLIRELEQAGVIVQSISPVSLLALQHFLDDPSESDMVIWKNGPYIETFTIRARQPIEWRVFPAVPIVLMRHMRIATMAWSETRQIKCCQLPNEFTDQFTSLPNSSVDSSSEIEIASAASTTCQKVLTGRIVPWIELRRDSLAPSDPYRHMRGSISSAMFIIAASLAIVFASLSMRAQQYGRFSRNHQQRKEALFEQIFQGQTIPAGIQSRLASEKTKLAAIAGQSSDVPERPSALLMIHQLLSALPNDTELRLDEILLDEGNLFLNGQANSHSDAARIAAALKNGGFDVEPPRSEQLSNHAVTVRINAKWHWENTIAERTFPVSAKPQIVKQP
jgi:hypothetical protein